MNHAECEKVDRRHAVLALILTPALSSTAFAAVDDTGYSDVDAGNPYAEAILYCREHGLMESVDGLLLRHEYHKTPGGIYCRRPGRRHL